jgi:hypothetical protein
VWHASIAFLKASGPVPIARWGEGTLRDARRRLSIALEGVGTGVTVVQEKGKALHARRSLADEEIARLSPAWLQIPARDEFSEEGIVEMSL